jgi:AcrR family transcriptional regulator
MAKKKRKRLSGEEARQRILDAADQELRKSGPDGLKLTSLAKELGVSHQAILHHFGSRDGLVEAVVRRALESLWAELAGGLRVLEDHERGTGVLLDRAFDVMVDQGHGRLLAWLALADPHGEMQKEEPLAFLAQMSHAVRERDHGPSDLRDTTFMLIMLSHVVLGMSVFEEGAFVAAGLGDDPSAKKEYRSWVRDLVVRHFQGGVSGDRMG